MTSVESVVEIVEEYILKKTKGISISHDELCRRFHRAGVPKTSLHEVTIEILDDWDREEIALMKDKSSKRNIILGATILTGSLVIAILTSLGVILQGKIGIYMFGVMAAGILSMSTGIVHLQKAKLRKERRRIKWQVWDK